MKKNKLKILSLAMIAILAQSTCVYAKSSNDKGYTKEELENITPGFEVSDIKKSNYKVNSYKSSFSNTQLTDEKTSKEESSADKKSSKDTNSTSGDNIGNVIVSTIPSTGRRGDFWGKTKNGKWILIEQGNLATGWKSVKGKWYYMDADGVMQTGWINDGEKWYYLNSDGSMAYNTYVDGYYINWDGEMQ